MEALLDFFFPKNPNLTKHQRNNSPVETSQAAGDAQAWMGWQHIRGITCPCVLLFRISDILDEHTQIPGEGCLSSPMLLYESHNHTT